MKKQHAAVLAALILGAVGARIRTLELKALFSQGELPVKTPLTTVFVIFSALVLLGAAAYALWGLRNARGQTDWLGALGSRPAVTVSALCGLTLAVSASFVPALLPYEGTPIIIFRTLACLGGLAMVLVPWLFMQSKSWKLLSLPAILPAVFACYWMAIHYRTWSGDPTVTRYGLVCLALGAAAVALSFLAGLPCSRSTVPVTVGSGLGALYLIAASLPELEDASCRVAFAAMAVFIAVNTALLPEESVEKSISNETEAQ